MTPHQREDFSQLPLTFGTQAQLNSRSCFWRHSIWFITVIAQMSTLIAWKNSCSCGLVFFSGCLDDEAFFKLWCLCTLNQLIVTGTRLLIRVKQHANKPFLVVSLWLLKCQPP